MSEGRGRNFHRSAVAASSESGRMTPIMARRSCMIGEKNLPPIHVVEWAEYTFPNRKIEFLFFLLRQG